MVAGLLLGRHGHADERATADDRTLPARQARALGSDLTSGDPARVRGAVALPSSVQLSRVTLDRLRTLGTIRFDPQTFRSLGPGRASIRARVTPPSGGSRTWRATLVFSGGAWKVAGTSPGGAG